MVKIRDATILVDIYKPPPSQIENYFRQVLMRKDIDLRLQLTNIVHSTSSVTSHDATEQFYKGNVTARCQKTC